MKHSRERRSVFKKGKGLAFLKFLIGELTLLTVVCVCYLFILQGDVSLILPVVHHAPTATYAPLIPSSTPAPTAADTLAPTPTPTLAPTATPVPFEELSLPLGEDAPEAPLMPNEQLKLGMSECRAFTDAGQNVLIVAGHAYIEGRDAARSGIYLLVIDAGNGNVIGTYPAFSTPENAYLTFGESSGSNLSHAFFTAKIDVSEYYSSSYMVSVLVVNEDKVAMNYFDTRTYHFRMEDGALVIEE